MFRLLSNKHLLAVGSLIVAMALILSGVASGASSTKNFSTNFTLVNLDPNNPASVTAQYVTDTGLAWGNVPAADQSFDLASNGGSVQVKQYFATGMDSGKGSVVVQSSTELGAVVQIQARGQTPSQGAYSGFKVGSNKFYVPLVAHQKNTSSGLANSQIIVQNADSVPLTVTVDLIPGTTNTETYSKVSSSLQPGQSFYYDVADETNLPAGGWLGSAVVTGAGTGKITVISNFFTGADTMQTFNGFPSDGLGTSWLIPTLFVRLPNGLSTVVAVQNLSGADIAAGGLTLACTTTKGSVPATFTATNPGVLPNNASYSFNPVTDITNFATNGWEGTCLLSSGTATTAAIIQLRYVNSPSGNVGAAAYEAIRGGGTDTKMYVPLVAKRLTNGFATVVSIQNLSTTADAHATLYYIPTTATGGSTITETVTIPAGQSIQRNHRLASDAPGTDKVSVLPDNWEGSLRVESSDQAIDGYVQMTYYMNVAGDQFMAHRPFTKP